MDFNWNDNIVFIPCDEWLNDFDWNYFADIVAKTTGLYPVDKGDNPIIECGDDGVNYHFRLVSKEVYKEWYLNN
jgi:hypothetical protein